MGGKPGGQYCEYWAGRRPRPGALALHNGGPATTLRPAPPRPRPRPRPPPPRLPPSRPPAASAGAGAAGRAAAGGRVSAMWRPGHASRRPGRRAA